MGLIRKSLMVGSMGVVRGSSKKQRVAKAQLNELRTQTYLMQQQNAAQGIPTSPAPSSSVAGSGEETAKVVLWGLVAVAVVVILIVTLAKTTAGLIALGVIAALIGLLVLWVFRMRARDRAAEDLATGTEKG